MRFVSQYTNYIINIRAARKKFTEYGVEIESPDILAEFDSQDWVQRDLETALSSFQFKGMFQHEDEATPVHPAYRIVGLRHRGAGASAGLGRGDEDAGRAEAAHLGRLRARLRAGTGDGDGPRPGRPTTSSPSDADELAMQVLDLGYDPDEVIAYETSKWGQNREDVVAALQAVVEARDAGEIIVT